MKIPQTTLIDQKNHPGKIKEITKKIYRVILKESQNLGQGNFNQIGTVDLIRLFELYDQYFFNGFFYDNCKDTLSFRLSSRMTKTGGKVTHHKNSNTYTISLSTVLLFQTFEDVQKTIRVNGLVCYDRLEAAMRILEHEIIHLMELVVQGSSSCSNNKFRHKARNIFGHTETTHQLITQEVRALAKYKLKIGDKVLFDIEGEAQRGIIYRITKRATVMVKNSAGNFRDSLGNRYIKYYIPLQFLKPIKD